MLQTQPLKSADVAKSRISCCQQFAQPGFIRVDVIFTLNGNKRATLTASSVVPTAVHNGVGEVSFTKVARCRSPRFADAGCNIFLYTSRSLQLVITGSIVKVTPGRIVEPSCYLNRASLYKFFTAWMCRVNAKGLRRGIPVVSQHENVQRKQVISKLMMWQ